MNIKLAIICLDDTDALVYNDILSDIRVELGYICDISTNRSTKVCAVFPHKKPSLNTYIYKTTGGDNKMKKKIITNMLIGAVCVAFVGVFAVQGYNRKRLRTYSTGIMENGDLCLAFEESTKNDEARQVRLTDDNVLEFKRSNSFLISPFTRHTAWIYSPKAEGYTDIYFPNDEGGHCIYNVKVDKDMKIRYLKSVDEADKVKKEHHGKVICAEYTETGGEDGRHNEWKVWEEGGKYKLSLKTDDLNYSQGEYEISEEDFKAMTDNLDLYAYLDEVPKEEGLCDAVCYDTTLTFEDGAQCKTPNYIYPLHSLGYDMLEKYKEETK